MLQGIDVLSMSMANSDLYTCSANGLVQRFSASFDCTASWHAHNGIVLSSIITHGNSKDHSCLITGGNDEHIKVCPNLVDLRPPPHHFQVWELTSPPEGDSTENDRHIVLPSLDCHASGLYPTLGVFLVLTSK